jgi:hypothetical protein
MVYGTSPQRMRSPGGTISRKNAPAVFLVLDRNVCGFPQDFSGLINT